MSASDHGSKPALPAELERALQRATVRSLASLVTLRKALREHVQNERGQGATLPEIERDLRALVSRVEAISPRSTNGDGDGRRDGDGHGAHDNLSAHLVKWTAVFYGKSD